MELINIESRHSLNIATQVLKKGGVTILPTDTIYGFSALADNLPAIEKIKKIKKRTKTSFIILVSSFQMLKKYCQLNQRQSKIIEDYLQKQSSYSFVLESKSLSKPYPNKGSLAVRLPKFDFLTKMIEKLKMPIISTSLNLHQQELIEIKNIENFFKAKKLKPDLVVIDKKRKRARASNILDIRYNKIVKLR